MSSVSSSLISFLVCLASSVLAQNPPQLSRNTVDEQHIVRPGVTTTLECPVKNSKDLMFEWYKENESIMTYGGSRLKKLTNGSLRIKETHYDDTGVYRCRAINGFGSVEFNTTLLVIGSDEDYENYGETYDADDSDLAESKISLTSKPRLLYYTKDESPVFRQPGSTFRLQCVATGYPKPEMMWYKDGSPVAQVFRFGRWALKFTKAIPTDSGNYTCVASNPLGSASHSWKLIVDDKRLLRGRPLLFGKNTSVTEGEKAVMECGVKSDSFPHIEWLKEVDPDEKGSNEAGTVLPMEGEYFNVLTSPYNIDYVVKNGVYYHKLIIESARKEDAGKYVCLGANTYGFEYRFFFLEVIPKTPNFESSLPFPILVTAIVVAIATLGCILAVFVYCRPKHRSGSPGSSTAVPMVSKDDFIPMHPASSTSSRCNLKQCTNLAGHQITYKAALSNGMI